MQKLKGKQEWTLEQKTLLTELFPKYSSKKWKMISMEMAQKGFKRTELECRQKWINFLDPSLNNEEWSSGELQRLYNYHDKHGTRWCFMQKELNRTQNKIKNRFYGTIRNYIRLVLNTLCQKNTCFNTQINKISPSLLNDLYNSENSNFQIIKVFDFLKGQIKKIIYRMKFKIDKKVLRNRIRDKESLYRELLGLIGSLFKGSFSIKFLEKIENDDSNDGGVEIEEGDSVKEIQRQDFVQESKIIKSEHVQNTAKDEGQHGKKTSKLSGKNIAKQSSQVQNASFVQQQNNQIINSSQHLYATSSPRKNKTNIQEHGNANNQEQASFAQNGHFYPFYNYSPDTAQHDLMINNFFQQPTPSESIYHLIIERIRMQNILMMQRQQEMLISQLVNGSNMNGK